MKSQSLQATKLAIRPATVSDTESIAELIVEAFGEHKWVVPPISALRETSAAIAEKMRKARGLIAEYGGDVAGCVFYEPLENPTQIYLSRLAVSPEFRGLGIARQLIAEVERRAIDGGYPLVRLATRSVLTKNVALYERLGYVVYEYDTHPGSDEITTVKLEKKLS